ncbi:hypothetical protein GEOBRER4_n2811 [Citrifermentans bremense]|uniref:Uncharacterized protein n=1 Tax=Citrifermentans bremense TaxID=60035 RepID=A0A7R7IYW6_9BACT|nr:hypothetical protein GEOBRER4_n2811 [Citrifermentans bremense]
MQCHTETQKELTKNLAREEPIYEKQQQGLRHLWRSQFLPEYFKGKIDRPSGIRVAKRRETFY